MAFSKDKKNSILILILILGTLGVVLWWLKTTTVMEGFNIENYDDKSIDSYTDAWTSIGNQASNLGGAAKDYISGQTDYMGISNGIGSGTGDENTNYNVVKDSSAAYDNVGDAAMMRAQAAEVAYLKTINNPTMLDTIKIAAYNPAVFSSDKTIYVGTQKDGRTQANYDINNIANDIINQNPQQQFQWSKVFVDDRHTAGNTINIIKTPDLAASLIVDDACSTKGIFNSDFKEDICTKYADDNITLDNKCRELSPNTCAIPSCCVLLNKVTCVAGNQKGPTFISQNGVEVDYSYYYYKNKCYGTGCALPQSFGTACENYMPGSTGISKECMVQMFNNYGCPNGSPDWLINDAMVLSYSQSTKKHIDNYIKTAVDTLKQQTDPNSKALCYGGKKANNTTAPSTPNNYANNPSLDTAKQGVNDALEKFKFGNS